MQQVLRYAQVPLDHKARAFRHQAACLLGIEAILPPPPYTRGDGLEQAANQLPQARLHLAVSQIRFDQPHPAVDVVSHTAGRNDSAFGRVSSANPPDAETVAPVNIWHGQTSHLNAG